MTKKSGTVLALLICSAVGVLWISATAIDARAQGAREDSGDARYQISAWSNSASERSASMHGAYVIDRQTGKIWSIINEHKPKEIGVAE